MWCDDPKRMAPYVSDPRPFKESKDSSPVKLTCGRTFASHSRWRVDAAEPGSLQALVRKPFPTLLSGEQRRGSVIVSLFKNSFLPSNT